MTALPPALLLLVAALAAAGFLRLRRVRRVLRAAFLAPTAEREEALIASLPRLELRAYFLLMQWLDRLRGLAGDNPAQERMLAERERRLQARLQARALAHLDARRRPEERGAPPAARDPAPSRERPAPRDPAPPPG